MRALAFLPGGMPGIAEIGVIVLILVLLFGARKLPELSRSLGSSLAEFRKGRREGERKDEKQNPPTQPSPEASEDKVNADKREGEGKAAAHGEH
jgi:sec-independent protein translocase protein TatA